MISLKSTECLKITRKFHYFLTPSVIKVLVLGIKTEGASGQHKAQENWDRDFPGGSVVDSALPLQGTRLPPLVGGTKTAHAAQHGQKKRREENWDIFSRV